MFASGQTIVPSFGYYCSFSQKIIEGGGGGAFCPL